MILSEHKSVYLDALESADGGEYLTFADFMLLRSFDTMTLVAESLRNAKAPSVKESLAAINGPYLAKGEYSEQQIDEAGARLLQTFGNEAQKEVAKVSGPKYRVAQKSKLVWGRDTFPLTGRHKMAGRICILR